MTINMLHQICDCSKGLTVMYLILGSHGRRVRMKPGNSFGVGLWKNGAADPKNSYAKIYKIQNDSSADPKQIGWRLLAEESWLRTPG